MTLYLFVVNKSGIKNDDVNNSILDKNIINIKRLNDSIILKSLRKRNRRCRIYTAHYCNLLTCKLYAL